MAWHNRQAPESPGTFPRQQPTGKNRADLKQRSVLAEKVETREFGRTQSHHAPKTHALGELFGTVLEIADPAQLCTQMCSSVLALRGVSGPSCYSNCGILGEREGTGYMPRGDI